MSVAVALMAGVGILLITTTRSSADLSARIGRYLRPEPHRDTTDIHSRKEQPVVDAGLAWSGSELLLRRSAAAVAGAVVGILVAQGDLFVQGPGRSVLPLAALGAATGWLVFGMWLSTRRERRARRLRFELPVVTDAISLHIIAGESVATAVRRFAEQSSGVASEEMTVALDEVASGRGIAEALQRNVHRTADPEAGRLYTLLAHAHDTGGRLADSLGELGIDYRAALARDLTSEGGRRALATYGPILALMVPVTLLFLLYPTIAGLRSLAGGP
jgi:tight adherence protein C